MSAKITVKCEIRDMLIMKETLKELNYTFNEQSESVVSMSRPYQDIVIDANEGTITLDDMDTSMVNDIKRQYTLNYYRDQAIKEGMQIREETMADGRIEIYLTRPE